MFDEAEFLDVARHLHHADSREGFQRSAISRAYYAAFLLARRALRTRGAMPQGGGGSDHRRIADLLETIDPTIAEAYGILRRLRNEADYSTDALNLDELAATARYTIDISDQIRERLERLD